MARSKKDGRQGAGHKARKWQTANTRRRVAARKAARESAMAEYEAEQHALDAELVREFEEQFEQSDDWMNDYLNWQGLNDAMYSDEDLEYGYYEGRVDFSSEWQEHDPYDVGPDVFLHVDRAVRRHGVEAVRKQAPILASALDVPLWEIERSIRLTRAGYINH